LESIKTANVQKATAHKKAEKITEPLPLSQTLAEFVKKTESMQAGFVEVEDVEDESGYKNVVKLDNKTFKDEFRKVLYFYSNYMLCFNGY